MVDVSGAVIVIVEVSFCCRCFCCTSGGCSAGVVVILEVSVVVDVSSTPVVDVQEDL